MQLKKMLNKSEVKYIQSLSQKKFREAEAAYLVEGPKIVQEALAADHIYIKKLYALPDWLKENATHYNDIEAIAVTDFELQKISQLKTPNQVVALIQMPDAHQLLFAKDKPGLMLDGIQDPGNLGTIIRIADWFGMNQIICSQDCADLYNAKVVQATMGSIFRVNVFYAHLDEWIAQHSDLKLYGAALDGIPVNELPFMNSGLIVIGNESKGIRPSVMKHLSQKITIPKRGNAESLNAAVATGIILSHLKC